MILPNYDTYKLASPYDTPESHRAEKLQDMADDAASALEWEVEKTLKDYGRSMRCREVCTDEFVVEVDLVVRLEADEADGRSLARELRRLADRLEASR